MKLAGALCLLFVALAAPTAPPRTTDADLPPETPVNIQGLDPDFDMKCGKVTVKGINVYKAASYGVNLQVAGKTVKSDRTEAEYPHIYLNHEGFTLLHPDCNKNQTNRREFPILKDDTFKGGDEEPHEFRAIYLFDPKAGRGGESYPTAIYCGTVYHPRGERSFRGCDVTNQYLFLLSSEDLLWSGGS